LKYFPNDGWFGMDNKSWPVAFHGVGYPTALIVSNITIMGLKIAKYGGQAYKGDKCVRTKNIIGEGIYCTPKIEIAE
jgi:hypothetical protein